MKFDATLMKLVEKDLEKGLIPMLLGEPGIGKSSWVIALGEKLHTKVFVLACNQLADKADLTGARLVPNETTGQYEQVFYPHAIIAHAINYAKDNPRETPILFMDELNRTTPDVTSEALSIPTLRSIGNTELPANLRVVTAGNDKGNITSLDQASISRFVLYHVDPDVNTFIGLDPELNIFVKNVLTHHPETIFCKSVFIGKESEDDDADKDVDIDKILEDGETMAQITTPRTISGVSNWLNSFTNQELMELLADTRMVDGEEISVLQEALEGHTGKTNFTQFLLAEITNGVMSVNNQSNTVTVPKPNCYDAMKKCSTMDDLRDLVSGMTENEKSGCLVYAIFEPEDNRIYINALADATAMLQPGDMKTLMMLYASDKLDEENKNAFLNSNTQIANTLSYVFNA